MPTVELPPPTTAPPRPSDGVLRIGVLLPLSGPGSSFGPGMVATVERAVEIINDAGGVLGNDVQIVVEDEGADADTAVASLDRLLQDERVDAVIGPASSRVALAVLGQTVAAGVLTCSPAATASALSRYPDQGLFFRTIPSDALQAQALARVVDQTGLGSVAIAFPDDTFGRTFAEDLRSALTSLGIPIVADVGYDPSSEDHDVEAAAILADLPPVVALIGDSDVGVRMLTHVVEAAGLAMPVFVTNDAMRRPAQPELLASLASAQLARIKGVSPSILPQSGPLRELLDLDAGDPAGAFAAPTMDCVNLIALAAVQAGTDASAAMASAWSTVSRGGTSCRDFPTCVELLSEGRNIDYDGFEGEVRFDASGDPVVGRFERFGFDASGRDVTELRFDVSLSG